MWALREHCGDSVRTWAGYDRTSTGTEGAKDQQIVVRTTDFTFYIVLGRLGLDFGA